ncbi:MAG: hypothetical protein ACYTGB_09360 [Planctomycetota bacterium]|jgi:hypothetical protein
MSLTVLWCDEWVRLDPLEGAAIDRENQAPEGPPVRLTGGRNAAVSFQLLIGPVKRNAAVTVRPGRLKGPGGAGIGPRAFDVYVEWYHRIDGKWYPDALVPQEVTGGSTPAFRKNVGLKNPLFAGFWVDLHVPADARPGAYAGGIKVTVGRESVTVPVEALVKSVKIGPDATLDMSFNNYADSVSGGWPEVRSDPRHLRSAKYLRVERAVWRAAHDHRGFIHYMPYGHSGYVTEGFAPPTDGAGPRKRVTSWKQWDKHFGPYFDGSAFRGTRRGAVPVKRFYLPLNLNWPADFVKYGQPGYEAEWRAVGKQMVEHFRKKRWTKTRFDMFLNHKQRFRYFPWDCEECRFLHDNNVHRYFRKLWEGTFDRKSTRPVTFDYTLGTTWVYEDDIHSDMSEFIDVYIAGTGGPAENRERQAVLQKAGRQIWSCTHSGGIVDSTRAAAYTPLLMWMRDVQGFMPRWCSLQWGADPWHETPGAGITTFFYPGAEFGTEDAYPSIRAKILRNQMQWVDQLEVAAHKRGKAKVKSAACRTMGMKPGQWFLKQRKLKTGDWGSEEAPVSGWRDIPSTTFRKLRAQALDLGSGG